MKFHHIIFFLLISFYIDAEEIPPQEKTITPDELFVRAKKNNPMLNALSYRQAASEYSKESAKSLMEPKLKFEIQRLPVTRPYDFMGTDMYMFAIEQEIILPQKLNARTKIEEYEQKRIKLVLDKTELDLELRIFTLFYKYHYNFYKKKILNEELKYLKQLRDIIAGKYIASQLMQTDVFKNDYEILMVENELINLHNEYVNIRSEINYLLGKDGEEELPPPSDYEIERPETDKRAVKTLITLRPEVKIVEMELKKKDAIKKFRNISMYMPDLMVAGGYQLSPMMQDGLYFMVSISIPWFNKKNEYEYKMEEKMYLENEEMYRDQINMSAQEIYSLITRLNGLYDIIRNLEKMIKIQEHTLSNELSMYEKNQTTYINLIDTLRELFGAKKEYLEVKSEYIMTYIDLLRCCGLSLKSSFIKKEDSNE